MAAAAFDDDLFDFDGVVDSEGGSTVRAEQADGTEDSASAARNDPDEDEAVSAGAASEQRARKRGSRGGSHSRRTSAGKPGEKRWRSGAVPTAPVFEGNVEEDPYLEGAGRISYGFCSSF